ncbi:MAG: inner membrane CreD family protein, partial [Yersinia sp. (in: enterobacteria)]
VLFGLLQSEDNALLLGAGLLFIILAAVMVLTRRLDWYQVANPQLLTGQKSSETNTDKTVDKPVAVGGSNTDAFRLWD